MPTFRNALATAAGEPYRALNQQTLVPAAGRSRTPDNQVVDKITLRNPKGIEVTVITLGGIITSIKTPDRSGAIDDIVLCFDTLEPYVDRSPYFGSLIGRYGNRIAKARFTLDGTTYALAANNDLNHLHGGRKGWDKVVWAADGFQHDTGVGVKLTYTSVDGEEGYPTGQGRSHDTLTDENALAVDTAR